MKKYKILGLTGQTGAGKSTVSKVFAKNGTAVINADELVAELYMPDSVCLKILSAEFGSDIILPYFHGTSLGSGSEDYGGGQCFHR